jgi:protein-S-isoprenylcysteine O-methyltransferase Ste14
MKGWKVTLWSGAIGALLGALVVKPNIRLAIARIPFLALDQALLSERGLWISCFAGWVLLSLYWEIAAGGAAGAERSESTASRGIHVFLTSVAQIFVLAPIRGLGRAWPVSAPIMLAGLGVEAVGLFLAIWARILLGKNWSGRIAVNVGHELVRSGPYNFLRHPIYSGLLAMYVGSVLVTGEWLAVIGLVVAGFAYWRKIRLEEATLSQAFGANYEAYRRNTWALVPGVF